MKRNAPINSRRRDVAANFEPAALQTSDDAYCHLVARRAVVRAALYLGVETMSQEALDTVAGALMEYLSRIGSTLAASVESSGRSSAHCSIMDAIRVVELMTPPCNPAMAPIPAGPATSVGDDNIIGGTSNDNYYNVNHHPDSFTSWKDLAVFCFGPSWIERGKEMRRRQENKSDDTNGSLVNGYNKNGSKDKLTSNRSTGGKRLNLPPGSAMGVTLSIDGIGVVRPGTASHESDGGRPQPMVAGWNAPYPDEIAHFPVCLNDQAVANPHILSDEKFHSRSETELIQDHDYNEGDEILTTNKSLQQLNATNNTTTAISSDAIIQNIRNTISSLDEIPDDVFTDEKRYSSDFFAPIQRNLGDKHKHETLATTTAVDSTLLANASSTAVNGSSDEKCISLSNNNTKLDDQQSPSSLEPAKKKAKIGQTSNATGQNNATAATATSAANAINKETSYCIGGDETNQVDYANRPLYVPTFYPPFPSPRPPIAQTFLDFDDDGKLDATSFHSTLSRRKTKRVGTNTEGSSLRDTDIARSVRSALIQLGQQTENQYWGSYASDAIKKQSDVIESITNPDDGDQDNKKSATSDPAVVDTSSLFVRAGLAGDVSTTQQASSIIVPLNRASGSRISRVLEGSMDAPTM